MTKAELIEKIAEKLQEPKKNITPIVESVFNSIMESLAQGKKCKFVGFGVFEVKDRAAREGRNPQNPSQTVSIPAKKAPVFRPGKRLKEKVLALRRIKKKK
jgi:DNA-binding protein HU-beta